MVVVVVLARLGQVLRDADKEITPKWLIKRPFAHLLSLWSMKNQPEWADFLPKNSRKWALIRCGIPLKARHENRPLKASFNPVLGLFKELIG